MAMGISRTAARLAGSPFGSSASLGAGPGSVPLTRPVSPSPDSRISQKPAPAAYTFSRVMPREWSWYQSVLVG